MSALVLLDNEAVQSLGDPAHPKHRQVLSHIAVVAQRKRLAVQVSLAVPTAVRVEAGWDRTDPQWAFANHLRITDEPLKESQANTAAGVRRHSGVSVADAHLGAVIQASTSSKITVLTSDPEDVRAVAGSRIVNILPI
ncbi:MAG: hypothetical protein ACYCTI_05875 [Acidimicrobiales bacterium]